MQNKTVFFIVGGLIILGLVVLTSVILFSGKEYIITFETQGGSSIDDYWVKKGDDFELPTPEREGYLFVEWYYLLEDKAIVVNEHRDINNHMTLYARWQIITYEIQFNTNGGTPVTSLVHAYDELPLKPADPTKDDYVFIGWTMDLDHTIPYDFDVIPDDHMTLYAKWEAVVYEIVYHLDDGINPVDQLDVYTIEDEHVVLMTPSKVGHTFVGWYETAEFTSEPITEINPTEMKGIHLFAQWAINTYTIDFDSNGGSVIEELSQPYNTDVTEPDAPQKTGYSFLGWFLNQSHEIMYNFTTMPAENLTLYAHWKVNNYTIDYYDFEDNAAYYQAHLDIGETLTKVFPGVVNTAFLTSEGRLIISGRNTGNGILAWNATPIDVTPLFSLRDDESIIHVSGTGFVMAVLTDHGRVFTWGSNQYGQLGDGTTVDKETPVDITANFGLNQDEVILFIGMGLFHGVAVTSENRLFTWGRNDHSQLGNNATMDSLIPIDVSAYFHLNTLEEIIALEVGHHHTGMLTSESRVFTWGRNQYGQLGNNTTFTGTTPQQITGLLHLSQGESIVRLSMNGNSSGALTSLGRVLVWGSNEGGQLADYTVGSKLAPIEVTPRFNLTIDDQIIDMTIGTAHSIFFTSKGNIFVVGSNDYGQFGDGTTYTSSLSPVNITEHIPLRENDTVISVSIGQLHTMVLTAESHIFAFGYNEYGQLSDNTTQHRASPVLLPFKLLVYFVSTQTWEYDAPISLPDIEKLGYHFIGWVLDKDRTTGFNMVTMPAHDLIVFAFFQVTHYTIHYHLDGGMNTVFNPYGYNVEAGDVMLHKPFKSDYLFQGWYADPNFLGENIEFIISGTTGDLHVYAKWIAASDYVDEQLITVGEKSTNYTIPIGTNDSATSVVAGGYQMSTVETTYELWYIVRLWAEANGYYFENNGVEGKDGLAGAASTSTSLPVTHVNWRDVIVWLNALSEMSGLAPVYRTATNEIIRDSRSANATLVDAAVQTNNNGYRLPTSVEWEMAARWTEDTDSSNGSILLGGRYWKPGTYASGATSTDQVDIDLVAWYFSSVYPNDVRAPMDVRLKQANDLGIYDLSGNVAEWVFDVGSSSLYRVTRGGSYNSYSNAILLALESRFTSLTTAAPTHGFRIIKNG